jgi:prevent-host-death family protein
MSTLSSREFRQEIGRAKKAAKRGPVFITDRGQPAYVLLTVQEYQRITSKQENILDLLGMPDAPQVEFEPPRLSDDLDRRTR